MSPQKRKGEQPAREAAEDESARRSRKTAGSEDIDRREEDGYAQPESSAQKGPSAPNASGGGSRRGGPARR